MSEPILDDVPMPTIPALMKHQIEDAERIFNDRIVFNGSDPGTGKTATILEAISKVRAAGHGRALVLCPKSIMRAAWVNDCRTFTPHLSIATAEAPAANRKAAFDSGADIVVINHDGVKWIDDHKSVLKGFDFLAVDESTAFKNVTANRTRAMLNLVGHFQWRVPMSGTPFSNRLVHIWPQAFIADKGFHLGTRFYAFRSATHDAEFVTATVREWAPKPGAYEVVADMLAPIFIRRRLEDVTEMPPRLFTKREVDMPKEVARAYKQMADHAIIAFGEGQIVNAVHAASQANKLLQMSSGAVYGDETDAYKVWPERYDLVAELVMEREHPCLIGFLWKHQRDGIIRALEKAGCNTFAVIDGDNNKDVNDTVTRFQAGEYRALLAHPRTAGHGLTTTLGRTVIWASPTSDDELFNQLNARVYRKGQTHKTEVISIVANNVAEKRAYALQLERGDNQGTAMQLLQALATS